MNESEEELSLTTQPRIIGMCQINQNQIIFILKFQNTYLVIYVQVNIKEMRKGQPDNNSHSREVPLYIVGSSELFEVHISRLNNVFQRANSNQYMHYCFRY